MNLIEIRELVSKRIEELKKPYEKDEKTKYLEEHFTSYNTYAVKDIPMNKFEQIIAAFQIIDTDLDLEEIKYRANKISKILTEETKLCDNMDEVIIQLIDFLIDRKETDIDTYKKYIDFLGQKGIFKGLEKQRGINSEVSINDLRYIDMMKILYNRTKKADELKVILDYIENDPETLNKIIDFYWDIRGYIGIQKREDYQAAIKMSRGRKRIAKIEKTSYAIETYNRIPTYIRKNQEEEKQYNKRNTTEILRLQDGLKKLKKADSQEEITEIDEILEYFASPEIKKGVLYHINLHNIEYQKRLIEEYNSYEQNKKTKILLILNKNNIKVSNDMLKDIMNLDIEDVSNTITSLKQRRFDANIIGEILRFSNAKTVEKINGYIDKGFLTTEFISNNLSIYNDDSEELRHYEESISFLNDLRINPSLFSGITDLLMSNNPLFINNIRVLMNYDLLGSIRTTDNYQFLKEENLEEKIDRFLEDGLESTLVKNLNVLNSENIKRIELLNALNFGEVLSDDEINRALFGGYFFIKDTELDEYIPTTILTEMDLQIPKEEFSNYTYTPRTYKIGNSLFSINKVNRLINNNSLYNALFTNKTISPEDYELVVNELKGKEKKRTEN